MTQVGVWGRCLPRRPRVLGPGSSVLGPAGAADLCHRAAPRPVNQSTGRGSATARSAGEPASCPTRRQWPPSRKPSGLSGVSGQNLRQGLNSDHGLRGGQHEHRIRGLQQESAPDPEDGATIRPLLCEGDAAWQIPRVVAPSGLPGRRTVREPEVVVTGGWIPLAQRACPGGQHQLLLHRRHPRVRATQRRIMGSCALHLPIPVIVQRPLCALSHVLSLTELLSAGNPQRARTWHPPPLSPLDKPHQKSMAVSPTSVSEDSHGPYPLPQAAPPGSPSQGGSWTSPTPGVNPPMTICAGRMLSVRGFGGTVKRSALARSRW